MIREFSNLGIPSSLFPMQKIVFFIYVTPHHQMRHKSQIQKSGFRHNVIEENTSFEMVKKLCFYHNQKLNYNLRNALYCGVANMRKMGLKLALFII